MTSTAPTADDGRALHQLAQSALGFFPPVHLVVRLAYALGPDRDVAYFDGKLEGSVGATITGRIIALTKRLIHIVDFADVPRGEDADEGGQVTVITLARTNLAKVEIPASRNHENWSGGWLGESRWPGELALTYEGYPQPIVLPGRRSATALFALHAGLLDDLTA
jgi:hypothetical protein